MTTLIIARHGNTFEKGQTPTRVGARTDLPLVQSGKEQAKKMGAWLRQNDYLPEVVYSSELKRTKETAEIAVKECGYHQPVFPLEIFNEIDYGPDENQTEEKVIERIGSEAIRNWNENGSVPPDWNFDPEQCMENWKNFSQHIIEDEQDIILVITSNGIARFAPYITGQFKDFAENHDIKLSTGAFGILQFDGNQWLIKDWNVKP
ncbi:MAG: histidine phosphatase family protein [Pseudomonadota bacterium]